MNTEELAETIFKMVERDAGQKKYKQMDIIKAMIEYYGKGNVNKADCKKSIRQLIDGGRLVYTYFGGSFIEVPHREGAAND